MAVDKARYKDLAFYSGFSYARQVYHGVINSYWDGYSQTINGAVVALPAAVVTRPAYIEWYLEYSGKFSTAADNSGINMGADTNNVYADGYNNYDTTGGDVAFKLHYIVYDRAV